MWQNASGKKPKYNTWGISVLANTTLYQTDEIVGYPEAYLAKEIHIGLPPARAKMPLPMSYSYNKNINTQNMAAILIYLKNFEPVFFK